MARKYIPHIIKEGARYHVISYVSMRDYEGTIKEYEVCNEPNCEINKQYYKAMSGCAD